MINEQDLLQKINSNFSYKQGAHFQASFKIDKNVFVVRSNSESLLKKLTRAISHLKIKDINDAQVSLTIEIWTGNLIIDLSRSKNSLIRLQREPYLFFYNPGLKHDFASFSFLDLKRSRAIFWVEDEEKVPWYEIAAPFRTIFHWFFIRNGYELIHGACVANEEQGIVFLGKSGRGKSSTSLTSLITPGMFFIGDDYILLGKNTRRVYCLYSSAKVGEESLNRFKDIISFDGIAKPKKEEKHVLFLHKDKIAKSSTVDLLALPIVNSKSKKSSFKKISSSVPFLEVASSTIFQSRPLDNKYSFKLLTSFIKRCRSYEFTVSENPEEIGTSIKNFLSKKKRKKPLISVIMPVYNAEKFIGEALESVVNATKDWPYEIIVVNDGATDNSLQVLKKWSKKIKIISQKNKGPSAARNTGIKKAKGEYIAFIDADDIWTTDHIKVLLSEFNKNDRLEISMGYSQRFLFTEKNKLKGDPILFPTFGAALFKSSVFKEVGLLTEQYHWHEDVDWYLRAREKKIKIAVTKNLVKYYRIHDKNITASWRPTDKKILHVLKSSLDRRKNISLPALKDFINES